MGWFEHKHCWRLKAEDSIGRNEAGFIQARLLTEDCRCGAVRTVEIRPGEAPVIRIATPPQGGE